MDVKPTRTRRQRWRRRLLWAGAVLLAAYAALWVVRLTRDYVPVEPRPFLAGGPLVFAHRGASGIVTEHTMAAYRRALADGADVIELDVHRARDGALVISHDRTLERALGVPLAIAEHEIGALREAVAARHPGAEPRELLPTLEEVMAAFPGVRLNIELKADSGPLAEAVAAAIARQGRQDTALVASFHDEALARFREASGGRVATAAGPGEGVVFYLCYLLEVPCRPRYEALQVPLRLRRSWPRVRLDTAAFVEFAHRHGLEIHYWTVDDEEAIRRVLALGADGVMTNYPARAVRARAAAQPVEVRP